MKMLPLLLSLVLSASAHTQNVTTDTSATFVTYWSNGDEKVYHIKKTESKYRDGEQSKETTSTYDAHLKVADSTEEGFRMEWTYRNMNTGGQGLLAEALTKINEGLKIVYTVNALGAFQQVNNLEEIQEYIRSSFTILEGSMKDDEAAKGMLQELKTTFQSRVAIENVIVKDIRLFHVPYGVEYYTTQKLQGEVELPNGLGGAPFPATLTFELSKLAPQSDFAQMVMKQEIDKVKAMAAIKDFVKGLASSGGAQISDTDLPTQIEIKDHSEFDIILSSGWLSRIYYKRFAKTAGYNKIDTLTFTESK